MAAVSVWKGGKMRKAVIEVGGYTVKEGPTGGWRVYPSGGDEPISIHDNRAAAIAAAKRYDEGDKRRRRMA